MQTPRLGCLTPIALAAALMTLLAIAISVAAQGGSLFSPGPLNAQGGMLLGGVRSHAETGGDCAACHTAPWHPVGIMERCLECHTQIKSDQSDPGTLHGALFQQSGDAGCLVCHTEHHGPLAELTRVEIDEFPHDATGFSLAKHTFYPHRSRFLCEDCHIQVPGGRRFEPVGSQVCEDCHLQRDAVYMDGHHRAFTGACLNCHDGTDHFSDFDHNRLLFPLENAHARLECWACHQGQDTPTALQQTSPACFDCHAKDDQHNGENGQQCVLCHSTQTWPDIIFDHAVSRFPLTGAHSQVACTDCHQQAYRGTPLDCVTCHAKDDQHNGDLGNECQLCHIADGWNVIIFDHAASRFPLTGAHAVLPCTSCHQQEFRGTPLECAGCHQEPEYHAGLFQNTCGDCHSTTNWQPAEYPLAHSFPRNHENASSCRDCHTASLTAYTCYTCHDQAEMIAEHREEGISDLSACARCHPDGTEDGDRRGRRDSDDDD